MIQLDELTVQADVQAVGAESPLHPGTLQAAARRELRRALAARIIPAAYLCSGGRTMLEALRELQATAQDKLLQ